MKSHKHRVCAFDELGAAEARRFLIDGQAICVVRIDDDVYAIADACSHGDVSLSEGEVLCDSLEIECWKHGSAFSLTSGVPSTLPATRPVRVFDASVEQGHIVVAISKARP